MPGALQSGGRSPRGRKRAEQLGEVEERRARVWMLALVRKLTIGEIAQVVDVARRTIHRDLQVVRKRVHEHLRKAGQLEEAVLEAGAEIRETTNSISRQAWADLMEAPKGSPARGRFLRVILSALVEQVKLMQSLGIVKRVPEEVLIGDVGIERHLQQLSDEEAAAAIEFLAQVRAGALPVLEPPGGAADEPAAVDRSEPVDPD